MKPLALLLAPAIALCGTFSGTVVSLEGTPVVGATVKVGTDSVTTPAGGNFTLARAAEIASRSGKTIASTSLSASPVTSHLAVENGHPRLSFAGGDIRGRARASVSPADARQAAGRMQAPRPAAARSQEDTLTVYWKGKRITVLPIPADTGNVTFRIDTAWRDDAGIPWNPRIAYGSLLDSRDGQTYRTVTIGAQTWMAENLNFATDSSWHFQGIDSTEPALAGGYSFSSDSLGTKYGRYYTWNAAAALPDSCLRASCQASRQGVCPAGWHLPDSAEWAGFHPDLGDAARLFSDTTYDLALKATKGWGRISPLLVSNGYAPCAGLDLLGFRALNSGAMCSNKPGDTSRDWPWSWWSGNESSTGGAWTHSWNTPWHLTELAASKSYAMAIRCLKD